MCPFNRETAGSGARVLIRRSDESDLQWGRKDKDHRKLRSRSAPWRAPTQLFRK